MKSKSNGTVSGIFHKLSKIEIAVSKLPPMKPAEPFLKAGIIYSGDNGQLICVHCAGNSAKYTGRDRSGHKVRALGPNDAAEWLEQFGTDLTCEEGCTKYATAHGKEIL